MTRTLLAVLVMALAGCAGKAEPARDAHVDVDAAKRAIATALDDFHDAAAHADEARYFAHFAASGVFLGTDATERWDVAAFRAYAHPHFAAGKAWAFRATRRAIVVSPDGRTAWFDEDLATERLGPARGSGVLALVGAEWKIEQYNLASVIPNDRFAAARAAIDAPPAPPPIAFEERSRAAHARAISAAQRGDFRECERELRALVAVAEAGDVDAAVGLHFELAWLRWSERDLAGAWAELDAQRSAHERSHLMGNMSVLTRVRELRDRAFVLREMAIVAPPPLRAETLAAATRMRARHDEGAATIGRHADVAVLEALFAARAGDAKAALAAAKRVDAKDDPVDRYVLALAFDAAKDRARADALRAEIRAARDDLASLVVAHRIDADAAR